MTADLPARLMDRLHAQALIENEARDAAARISDGLDELFTRLGTPTETDEGEQS